MEIHLTQKQQNSLAVLSAQPTRSIDDLVRDAVNRMLADEIWFENQVQIGIDQIALSEFLEEKEMDEHIARMLNS